jgi:peptide deformylase
MKYFNMSNIVSLVIYPDIRLKTASAEVVEFDDALRTRLSNMEKATKVFHGWGLAGVQIGCMQKIIYINHDAIVKYDDPKSEKGYPLRGAPLFMVNAKILEISEQKFESTEGCLSLPGVEATVQRGAYVKAQYQDEFGNEHIIETEVPTLAACIQHEIDHTNGITIAEHQSPLKRNMLIKKIEKFLKTRNHPTKADLNSTCKSGCSHDHH